MIKVRYSDMDKLRKSYIKNAVHHVGATEATEEDVEFLIKETKSSKDFVIKALKELNVKIL